MCSSVVLLRERHENQQTTSNCGLLYVSHCSARVTVFKYELTHLKFSPRKQTLSNIHAAHSVLLGNSTIKHKLGIKFDEAIIFFCDKLRVLEIISNSNFPKDRLISRFHYLFIHPHPIFFLCFGIRNNKPLNC